MSVHELNPCTDVRWPALLEQHPQSSIFHTQGWLRALQCTYGYKPVAFTTSSGDTLTNAILFSENKSPLTGRRLVSLPFSDHCEPLADNAELHEILQHLAAIRAKRGWRYIELRPTRQLDVGSFQDADRFSLHKIDLHPPLPVIQRGLHDSCVRRKIKRAEREELHYEEGRSQDLLDRFRTLLLLTRRRHKLPPQPAAWFQNVIRHLGANATIHMVSKNGQPAASILTLRHKQVLTYKYGCSDASMNNFGGTPFLFWRVIQQAKQDSITEFDLGRSSSDDPGLIVFKEHLGGVSSDLVYARSPAPTSKRSSNPAAANMVREALTRLPDPLFAGVGRLMYRHIG